MAMVKLDGNTYPVRISLKRLGARWSPSQKCWMIAQEKQSEAMALIYPLGRPPGPVEPVRTQAGDRVGRYGVARDCQNRRVCKDCGDRINYGIYCGKCEFR